MDPKTDFEFVAASIKRFGMAVGRNMHKFQDYTLQWSENESTIRQGDAVASINLRTGDVSGDFDMLHKFVPWSFEIEDEDPWCEYVDAHIPLDFDFYADVICRRGERDERGVSRLGSFECGVFGSNEGIEHIIDTATGREVLRRRIEFYNGCSKVFLCYLGFDKETFEAETRNVY